MANPPPGRKISVHEYHLMGEAGILRHEERVELLDGVIYVTQPVRDGHVGAVISLNHFLSQRLEGRALVSSHSPVRLSEFSEPEPDIALLKPRADFYGTATPRPDDVLLLVEVADSSLDYDRLMKLPLYANAGIPEVWIVNLVDQCVEVYREPSADGYAVRTVHGCGEALAPSALPDVSIRVEEILG